MLMQRRGRRSSYYTGMLFYLVGEMDSIVEPLAFENKPALMPGQVHRKLAAIMFTDIVGYSQIMQEDENRGKSVRRRHKTVFQENVAECGGNIIQYYGDGTLSIFPSAVSAVECAIAIQKALKSDPPVPLRIGIHLGDISYDDTEVFGHGVNIAARIEPVCNPGGIFISNKVYDEIRNHGLKAESVGIYQFKNVDHDLELFAVSHPGVAFPTKSEIEVINDIANKVNLSTIAGRSEAVRRHARRIRNKKRKRTWQVALISLFAVLAIAAIWRMSDLVMPKFEEGKVAIAVLPFANIGGEEENEYFSDGITEDILTLLSRIEGIDVTSRTSVMQYKDSEKSVRDIARELRVNTILEGSVRKNGDKVRINAQLIDAVDDHHIWAEIYDADLDNIFEVQSQVAEDITRQLKTRLTVADRAELQFKPAKDVVAYELYLKGRKKYRAYNQKDNEKAISYFRQALDIDPNYAYAYAGLGDAYAQKTSHSGQGGGVLDTAIEMSSRAIELDPKLSEGYKALGLAYHYKGEMEKAISNYKKALELDPNNDMAANNMGTIARMEGDITEAAKWAAKTRAINVSVPASVINLADIYMELGDIASAGELIDEGLELDPNYAELNVMKSALLIREGDMDNARTFAEKVISTQPDYPTGYELLGEIFLQLGNWEAAEAQFDIALDKASAKENMKRDMLELKKEFAHAKTSKAEHADEVLARIGESLEKDMQKSTPKGKMDISYHLIEAGIKAEMGKQEEAIESLKKAYRSGWLDYQSSLASPMFANLQDKPEFRQLIDQMKITTDSILREVNAVVQPGS